MPWKLESGHLELQCGIHSGGYAHGFRAARWNEAHVLF